MKRLFVLTLGMLIAIPAFATLGTRMVTHSTLSVGRGGTNIGIFDNTALMMTNPGGISFLQRSALDANFSLMVPTTHFTNSINPQTIGETNFYPLPAMSYVNRNAGNPSRGASVSSHREGWGRSSI